MSGWELNPMGPRRQQIKRPVSNIPWFISIPRSGANWIQGLLEVYFNQPRGPIINNKKDYTRHFRWVCPDNIKEKDLLFIAHHDQNGFDIVPSTSKEGDIFLYRNPMDVCYSNIKRDGREKRFGYFANEYKTTFNKWVIDGHASLILCYEDFVDDPKKEFKKLVKHFNGKWDEKKFNEAYAIVTKEALVKRNPDPDRKDIAYKEMLTEEYAKGRVAFRQQYTARCKALILTEENKPWLGRYFEE